MSGPGVAGVGVLTGWGIGVQALPEDARRAAADRDVIPLAGPPAEGERFRRSSRECRLAVEAVRALLIQLGRSPETLRGEGTALVYVTAAGYGASNHAFAASDLARTLPAGVPGSPEDRPRAGALHFPYTAPSAVPAEVAIAFGLTGPYVILIGGAPTTLEALWYAGRLLGQRVERALVLAVETFVECADLYPRARWLVGRPLVEAAACALLERGAPARGDAATPAAPRWEDRADGAACWTAVARRRTGETLACEPLIAVALAQAAGALPAVVSGRWRGRVGALQLDEARPAAIAGE